MVDIMQPIEWNMANLRVYRKEAWLYFNLWDSWRHRTIYNYGPLPIKNSDMPTMPHLAEFSRFLRLIPPSRAGFHESRFYRRLCDVVNRTWHLSFKPEYALLHHQRASGQLSVNCYMHGEAVLSGGPMTADLQHLNSL
jgi:hypothetical protein